MDRRRFLSAAVVGLPIALAYSADLVGEALDGYWLVAVEGEQRERILRIAGARMEAGAISVNEAIYGWLDARGMKPVSDWAGQAGADRLRLAFTTPASSRIEIAMVAGETSLGGTFRARNGSVKQVRLTRIPASEVDDLRAAARLARQSGKAGSASSAAPQSDPVIAQGQYHAGKDSRITLLYVGTFDCPACRGYELEYFGPYDLMRQHFPQIQAIRYEKVKLGSYRAAIRAADLPEDLRWAMAPQADGLPLLHTRGYPFFAGFVDDHLWGQGHGISGLEALVLPQLRRAVVEKSAA